MSGIDEVGMVSCDCVENPERNSQYWLIRDNTDCRVGYYNPDAFRMCNDDREDKFNPTSNRMRRQILENPQEFVESITTFICDSCSDRISEGHNKFDLMKKHVLEFITGDVFPRLS